MPPNNLAKIDPWLRDIIVDPLSKEPLTESVDGTHLLSPYGRKYPVVNGIYDLRLLNNDTTPEQQLWKEGQEHYESWSKNGHAEYTREHYKLELEGVANVYREIPIEGRCLDIGGHQGRLRAFLQPDQEYVSCDPFINVLDSIRESSNLTEMYPFLLHPINFLSCEGEFLPFASSSFDVVHMRSVIDHLRNPELAINEAYRTLRFPGALVIGIYVHGGKFGHTTVQERLKETIKGLISHTGIAKYRDHHIWHPSFLELIGLIESCGFFIDKVHWQEKTGESTCYIKALKVDELKRQHK